MIRLPRGARRDSRSLARLEAEVDELKQRLQRRDEMLVKAQDHAFRMGLRVMALTAAQGEEPHGYVRVPRRWLDALLPPLAKGVTAGISFGEAAVNASNAIRELMAVAGDEFVPAAAPSALLLAEFRKCLQWYDGVDFVRMADIECALTEALADLERMKSAEQPDTVKVPRALADLIAYALHGSGWFILNRKLRALLAGGEA